MEFQDSQLSTPFSLVLAKRFEAAGGALGAFSGGLFDFSLHCDGGTYLPNSVLFESLGLFCLARCSLKVIFVVSSEAFSASIWSPLTPFACKLCNVIVCFVVIRKHMPGDPLFARSNGAS